MANNQSIVLNSLNKKDFELDIRYQWNKGEKIKRPLAKKQYSHSLYIAENITGSMRNMLENIIKILLLNCSLFISRNYIIGLNSGGKDDVRKGIEK